VVSSRRLPQHSRPNALSRLAAALRAEGAPVVDLTESNPTRVGIHYPDDLLAPLADPSALCYEPSPFGLTAARRAAADDQRRRGAVVDTAQVILAASTSESYSWLFKLLCDPGESVLVPRPSYPLFEHLTALEGVGAHPYALEYDGRWEIDIASVAAAPPDVRAMVVVSPNNPTGSFLRPGELEQVTEICHRRAWALVVDEVFADYALDAAAPLTDVAARSEILCFTLGGLSKTVGLPQLKLGWCIVGGPPALRSDALESLELIADSYLSVATPVQIALPQLLARGAAIRAAIQERIRRNLDALRRIASRFRAAEVLRVEGGWSAVVRVPAIRSEEQLALDLLRAERILVHPGYFFDFPREAYVVISLLLPEEPFDDAVTRLLRFVEC
jgi:aspartate/methionine/tyrosine aminotransferase